MASLWGKRDRFFFSCRQPRFAVGLRFLLVDSFLFFYLYFLFVGDFTASIIRFQRERTREVLEERKENLKEFGRAWRGASAEGNVYFDANYFIVSSTLLGGILNVWYRDEGKC